MLICDTHADTLYAMQKPDVGPLGALHITKERLLCTDDVRVQALALFTGPTGLRDDPFLVDRELAMLARLKEDGFRQIIHIGEALPGVPNILLTIEGGELFHSGVDSVDFYAGMGVRAAAIVWNNENRLAFPAVGENPKGLTPYGRTVCLRMQSLGMAVDVSHLNAAGFADVLALGGPPPMASHSCAYALCPHPRNLTDGQLRELFAAGGYVGVNFYPRFLHPSLEADLDTVIDHMTHMCALGGQACVGLGSDFDGIELWPRGLTHAGELPALLNRMRQRGFGEALVRAIAGENFANYLTRVTASATHGPFCR